MSLGRSGKDVVAEVYRIMTDNPEQPVIAEDTIRQKVNVQVSRMSAELGLGTAWVTSAITTATNTRDYTLSTASEYARVLDLVYESNNWPLTKISLDEVLDRRIGQAVSTGRQLLYAVTVSPTQEVQILFVGYPTAVENIKALVSLEPSSWPKGPATPPTIPFSQRSLRALELSVAASCIEAAGEDKMVALRLDKSAPAQWKAEAAELERLERLVIIRLKRARGPRNYAWFMGWLSQ